MSAITWKSIPSSSAAVKAKLDYPVIDTDLHTIEFGPLLEDYIHKYGGSTAVDKFRKGLQRGSGYVANDWYDQTPEQRLARRSARPPWWALPTKNTLDLVTVSIPRLLHERLAEQGTDFAVLYPNEQLYVLLVVIPLKVRAMTFSGSRSAFPSSALCCHLSRLESQPIR